MKKTMAALILICILVSNAALAEVNMDGWTLTGDPYVDAHFQYTYMPTFEQMVNDSIASDLLDMINPIIGIVMDGYNLVSLNFDDAYMALLVDLVLNEDTLTHTFDFANKATLEDTDTILSCVERAAKQTLTDSDTLSLVLSRIEEMKALGEIRSLSNAETRYLDSLFSIVDQADKEKFIKYLCDDLEKMGKWAKGLNIAFEATQQITNIIQLSQAYTIYRNMNSSYQAVLTANLIAAQELGDQNLAEAIESFQLNQNSGFSATSFESALRDSQGNIFNAVFSVFLDDIIGACAAAAQATGVTVPFVTTTAVGTGTVAAGAGTVIGGVYLGVELGTLACDSLFNTQELTVGYKLLKASASFERINGQTLKQIAEDLRNNPTKVNAQKLHEAFNLQKATLLYSYDIFETWLSALDDQVVQIIHRDYQAAIDNIRYVKEVIEDCDCCKYIPIAQMMGEIESQQNNGNTNNIVSTMPPAPVTSFSPAITPQPSAAEIPNTSLNPNIMQQDLYSEVREIPRNNMDAILMMDTSGSMSSVSAHTGKPILSYAKEAALAFVNQAFAYNENYRVGLGTFDSNARLHQPMVEKHNVQILRDSISGMRANGQTNIAEGFDCASSILDDDGRADARQVIVLFTDGIHNCSGDPVYSGQKAMIGQSGKSRDIYTVGLVGALSEKEKEQVRAILDQSYAVRYIEIDEEEQIEGAFYLLGLAASSGDTEERIHTLRVRGAASVEVVNVGTGEILSATQSGEMPFGSVYMTKDNYEAIYVLDEGDYTLRVCGGDVRTIGIVMETMDGRAVAVNEGANLRFNGNAGTRLEAKLSFGDDSFNLNDLSFDPYTYEGPDPFSGEHYKPQYELNVPAGIANLPNGGLVSQRANGYSASVPNEANMPDRVHEQHLEIFNPFFESEGFIVESRTSYNTNYDHFTYFFGGSDMKLYRIAENGGEKERIINKKLVAYWVDETGIYYSDGSTIIRREHGESSGKAIVRQGVATGSNLSRMIRFGEYLYYISAKDRCIYAVPYTGGEPRKITSEAARCLTFAQQGDDVILIYNTYHKQRELEYLRAIDLNGNPIVGLESLNKINSHYFNYAHGYLYYCDKDNGCALYRVNLNNPTEKNRLASICASRIFLFDDYVVTTDDSKYFCVMRPDGSEFKTIYAPYIQDR